MLIFFWIVRAAVVYLFRSVVKVFGVQFHLYYVFALPWRHMFHVLLNAFMTLCGRDVVGSYELIIATFERIAG